MARQKGTPKTGGRQRGTPNKLTTELKEAILQAAELAGAEQSGDPEGGTVDYLRIIASTQPVAFCGLLGKVLPMTVQGTGKSGALLIGWLDDSDDGEDPVQAKGPVQAVSQD